MCSRCFMAGGRGSPRRSAATFPGRVMHTPATRPAGPADLLARALDATGDLVAGVRDDQWDAPTPCTGWNVRDLVNHVVGGNLAFARLPPGHPPSPPRPPHPLAAAPPPASHHATRLS